MSKPKPQEPAQETTEDSGPLKVIQNRMVSDDATEAIKGIPFPELSDLGEKLQAMERLRQQAKADKSPTGEIKILRAELALLALAYSALLNRKDFEAVEADNAKNYFLTVGSLLEVAEFGNWFRQRYPVEWVNNNGELKLLALIRKVVGED